LLFRLRSSYQDPHSERERQDYREYLSFHAISKQISIVLSNIP